MTRLCIAVLGAFLLLQTAPAQDVVQDVRDFRERQYVTGQRIGCEMQMAIAASEQDIDGFAELGEQCAALERRHSEL